jgi:hypothetical protein
MVLLIANGVCSYGNVKSTEESFRGNALHVGRHYTQSRSDGGKIVIDTQTHVGARDTLKRVRLASDIQARFRTLLHCSEHTAQAMRREMKRFSSVDDKKR